MYSITKQIAICSVNADEVQLVFFTTSRRDDIINLFNGYRLYYSLQIMNVVTQGASYFTALKDEDKDYAPHSLSIQ
ncbi:hypothetical protein KQX54_000967 [Cotesia glomerata]|uniref:Uncharacterized protein n=1 Tax=Cotesia glomerata TaxID=32391 RepID=A0AAV7IDX7_COTGL|nr:hypothetical protein KQX54_000967 [Cotesia glomerata]